MRRKCSTRQSAHGLQAWLQASPSFAGWRTPLLGVFPRVHRQRTAPVVRPLTMSEAAGETLRVSKRWLADNLEGVPYLRCGHKKLFDEAALLAIREAMRCPINSIAPGKVADSPLLVRPRDRGSESTVSRSTSTRDRSGKRSKSSEQPKRKPNVYPFPAQSGRP